MYKKLTVILALVLLLSFAACQKDPTETPTTQPTHEPGLNTTPSGFVGFGDSTTPTTTASTEDPTAPTEESTAPTEPSESTEPTEPKPTDPKPTDPKPTDPKPTDPKPTDPPADVTMPPELSIAPDAEGLIRFSHLSKKEQQNFFMEFGGDPAAFDAWLDMAKAAFQEKYPDVVYDGSPIVLPTEG